MREGDRVAEGEIENKRGRMQWGNVRANGREFRLSSARSPGLILQGWYRSPVGRSCRNLGSEQVEALLPLQVNTF